MLDLKPLPPAEAIDYLTAKGFAPSFAWQDVYAEEHAKAFTVAKMLRLDLLQTVHEHLVQAIKHGQSLRDFAAALTPLLKRAGWWGKQELTDPLTGETRMVRFGSPARLQTIYDVNLRTAYSVGRYQRAQRSKTTLPYMVYRSMQDARVRRSHAAWNGTLLPQDHPWWDTHYPPNGWRCRCLAYPLSAQDAADYPGAQRDDPATATTPWVNPRTGEVRDVPVGIDPGFDYHPGKGQRATQLYAEKLAQADLHIGVAAFEADRSALLRDIRGGFAAWLDEVTAQSQPRGQWAVIGALARPDADWLVAQGRAPISAEIAIEDRLVIGRKAQRHEASGDALTREDWYRLPDGIAQPEAVLYDRQTGNLLYVFPGLGDPRHIKVVVQPDFVMKKPKQTLNAVRTAFMMDRNALADRARYDVVRGGLD